MKNRLNSQDKKVIIPLINKTLLSTNKSNPIFAKDLVRMVNDEVDTYDVFNEYKLRICINYIRKNKILPIMSGIKGYWVSYDVDQMLVNAESLENRAKSILEAADGIRKMMKQVIKLQKDHKKKREKNKKYDF
jgi:hypothetical protein